jgi:hypothetical protein
LINLDLIRPEAQWAGLEFWYLASIIAIEAKVFGNMARWKWLTGQRNIGTVCSKNQAASSRD